MTARRPRRAVFVGVVFFVRILSGARRLRQFRSAAAKGTFRDGRRPNIIRASEASRTLAGPCPAGRRRVPSSRAQAKVRAEMSDIEKRGDDGPVTGIVVKAKPKTKKPSMYKVLMLNDDYTPMEFVVHILERVFAKTREEATRI